MAHAEDPGPGIVQKLQARYDDTGKCPDGLAAIYCNGVIIRAIRDLSIPEFWNPTPLSIERDGVSGSYIRKDVGGLYTAGRAGFIMRELKSPDTYPVKLRCVFPTNAGTNSRVKSCASEAVPLPCHLSGVTDLPSWKAHAEKYGPSSMCYFEPTEHWFQFSIDAREHFPWYGESDLWNELVFAAWPQDIPEQLPIEAFFFNRAGLEDARLLQERFIQATGKFLPIVRIELTHPDAVFFYAPKDQTPRYRAGVKAWNRDKVALNKP